MLPTASLRDLWLRVRASLWTVIGDIVFGMEDGAVSVARALVSGVSASTHDRIVVLAGATGAAAGAVSMMAGRYLDVQSVGHRTETLIEATRRRLEKAPQAYLDRASNRLVNAGFTEHEKSVVIAALRRNPGAFLDHVTAYRTRRSRPGAEGSPGEHAGWMFIADILAASVPVIPFGFDLETARIASMAITGV